MNGSVTAFGTVGVLLVGLFLVLIWLGPAILTGWLAGQRGRDTSSWFGIGILLGPLALVAVGLSPVTSGVRCHACKEPIREGATLCPHCHTRFGAPAGRPAGAGPGQPAGADPGRASGDSGRPPGAPATSTVRTQGLDGPMGQAVAGVAWAPAPLDLGAWSILVSTARPLPPGVEVTLRRDEGTWISFVVGDEVRWWTASTELRAFADPGRPSVLLLADAGGTPILLLQRPG